jgi:peptidoglycan LD-endopeptidase CwlK
MNLTELISAVQKELGLTVDGKAGPQTWQAIAQRLLPKTTLPQVQSSAEPSVDPRSEKNIATLQPPVQPYARALINQAAEIGITIKVLSGHRTYAEQERLYAQGRTTSGPKVTNSRGGYSNHNFGIAFDIGVFENGKYLEESPKYKVVGALGMKIGLEWGGTWKSFVDEPHYQLRPTWASARSEKEMLAEMRSRVAEQKDLFA